jgi:hypothetical protein
MIEITCIREVYGEMNLGDWRAEKRKVEERANQCSEQGTDICGVLALIASAKKHRLLSIQ